jgi:hypothetical protein
MIPVIYRDAWGDVYGKECVDLDDACSGGSRM